ncbi:hypothetical protein B0H11DRAFT_2327372 [Mycena galericulata]|nr:hypothetical protein B0H11DRAFT_2327372 [Mycena galericulata]
MEDIFGYLTCDPRCGHKSHWHLFFVLATSTSTRSPLPRTQFFDPPTVPFELYLHAWYFSGFIFMSRECLVYEIDRAIQSSSFGRVPLFWIGPAGLSLAGSVISSKPITLPIFGILVRFALTYISSAGKVRFGSSSGPCALNAEPERGVRLGQIPNLEPECAFRFSSAFERVRTSHTLAILGSRKLTQKYNLPTFSVFRWF